MESQESSLYPENPPNSDSADPPGAAKEFPVVLDTRRRSETVAEDVEASAVGEGKRQVAEPALRFHPGHAEPL